MVSPMTPYSHLGVSLNKQQLVKIYRAVFPTLTDNDIFWLKTNKRADWVELKDIKDARLPDGDLLTPSGGWLIKLTEWQKRWLATTTEISFRIQEIVDAKLRDKPRWYPGEKIGRTVLDYRVADGLPLSILHEIAKLLNVTIQASGTSPYTDYEGQRVYRKADYIKAIMAHVT